MPSPLCRRLTVSSAAENVSMPIAFASEPASKARRSGMASTRSSTVVRASSSSPTTRTSLGERVVEVGERGRGDEVEGGDDVRVGRRRLHRGGDRALRATARARTARPRFSSPLAIEMTTLPASWSAWAAAVGDGGVPHGGEHDELGVGGVVVGAGLEAGDPVAPAAPAARRRPAAAAVAVARPQRSRRGPTRPAAPRCPAPPVPSPPTRRCCMPRASHTPRPRTPAPRPPTCPSIRRTGDDLTPSAAVERHLIRCASCHTARHVIECDSPPSRRRPARARHHARRRSHVRRRRDHSSALAPRPAASSPCARGVYRVGGSPRDAGSSTLLAACLAAGPEARRVVPVGGRALGARGVRAATASRSRSSGADRARLEGVVVHETHVFGPRARRDRRRHPGRRRSRARSATSPRSCRPWMVERAVDEALRRKIVTLRRPRACRGAISTGRGRRRCTVMREILEHRAPGLRPGRERPRAAHRRPARARRASRARRMQHRVADRRAALPDRSLLPGRSGSRSSTTAGSSTRVVGVRRRPGARQRARAARVRSSCASRRSRRRSAIVDTVGAALDRASRQLTAACAREL